MPYCRIHVLYQCSLRSLSGTTGSLQTSSFGRCDTFRTHVLSKCILRSLSGTTACLQTSSSGWWDTVITHVLSQGSLHSFSSTINRRQAYSSPVCVPDGTNHLIFVSDGLNQSYICVINDSKPIYSALEVPDT
jgi:hypothetical protein